MLVKIKSVIDIVAACVAVAKLLIKIAMYSDNANIIEGLVGDLIEMFREGDSVNN